MCSSDLTAKGCNDPFNGFPHFTRPVFRTGRGKYPAFHKIPPAPADVLPFHTINFTNIVGYKIISYFRAVQKIRFLNVFLSFREL